ncbi:putative TonB-dependent receptor [Verrucomicrobia bacterium]|nr:putative TonB-dependent receptor [Verrucomicrobiota bacterium]
MIQKRKKRNSSKVNLTISLVFHSLLILAIVFLAAREGLIGKKLKQLAVTMVPKEKKPEPPKEKPPEPKVEPTKPAEAPKLAAAAPRVDTAPPASAPPPPSAAVGTAAVAAPAAVNLPDISFEDGAKDVQTISDANGVYKALVEHSLRSRWNRPEDIADDNYAAEVEVSVDRSGEIKGYTWLAGSGDKRWDDSVRAVMGQTRTISRPPPKGFPPKFNVRFDVESLRTEPVMNLSTR